MPLLKIRRTLSAKVSVQSSYFQSAKMPSMAPLLIKYLALIYAWTGEKDLALEHLDEATKLPSYLSYGQLRLHPIWDPLRGDPRFEKIVASLAPK